MEGEITKEDIEKNKWIAGISYIWILFILYWLVDSKFVKFHAKQSLTIFIAEVFFRAFKAYSIFPSKLRHIRGYYGGATFYFENNGVHIRYNRASQEDSNNRGFIREATLIIPAYGGKNI